MTPHCRYPTQWVVDCEAVGNGEKALVYLGRYLCQGVISDKVGVVDLANDVNHDEGESDAKLQRRVSARPAQLKLGAESADKWKPLGMPDRLDSQVDVQLGPIEVVCGWEFDVQNFANRDIPEPGKIGEWQKQFLFCKQEPEAVLRDVGYLNRESACAKRCGCHFRAPELIEVLRYFHAMERQASGGRAACGASAAKTVGRNRTAKKRSLLTVRLTES